ncbi:MAG: DNA repair and recombination protein RadB [Candidatus Nanohaloarchaea archaeon]
MKVERLSTGCEPIDSLLGGGIEKKVITNVYGEPGTGKTNFCIQVAAEVASSGDKAAFIDSESGFSPERFVQVASEDALENVFVKNPTDFEEQQEAVDSLEGLVDEEDIEVIIMDSAVSLYRLKVDGDNASEINQKLSRQLSTLSQIARKKNIPVLITNQVYTSFDEDDLELVGRDVPKYWSKCLLRVSGDSGVRKITVDKHRSIPEGRSTQFEITDNGLEEPEEKGLF